MVLPDVNLLLHAYDTDSKFHSASAAWWQEVLGSERPVGLCWVVILGFVRLITHRGIHQFPMQPQEACGHVRSWLAQPQVIILEPGSRHAGILFGLLEDLGTAGNLTTDAHLAALAIEHQCELQSTDADFSRFPGLRWRNPLSRGNGR